MALKPSIDLIKKESQKPSQSCKIEYNGAKAASVPVDDAAFNLENNYLMNNQQYNQSMGA